MIFKIPLNLPISRTLSHSLPFSLSISLSLPSPLSSLRTVKHCWQRLGSELCKLADLHAENVSPGALQGVAEQWSLSALLYESESVHDLW